MLLRGLSRAQEYLAGTVEPGEVSPAEPEGLDVTQSRQEHWKREFYTY